MRKFEADERTLDTTVEITPGFLEADLLSGRLNQRKCIISLTLSKKLTLIVPPIVDGLLLFVDILFLAVHVPYHGKLSIQQE